MKTLLRTLQIATICTFTACTANTKQTPIMAMNTTVGASFSEEKKEENTIQVALLLDTSNSMDGLIDQAKAQLWAIVNELSYAKCEHESVNLEIALYQYGNDGLESSDGYIQQVIAFSSDLDEISEKLFSLTTNGGSEFCGQVIDTSLKSLSWKKGKDDLKFIFIAGNEAFTQGKTNYAQAIADAVEKDVTVNTIFCGSYQNGVAGKWQDAATIGKGDYLAIDHNKRQIHVATPYDKVIIELNRKLNATYVSFGSQGYNKMRLQSAQDDNAMEVSEEIVVKRAVSKSSRMYNNSSWDLVDAEKEGTVDYKKLDKKQLPKELKGKSTSEIKAYVAKKRTEREAIQKEIQSLNAKRKSYIATQQKDNVNKDNLENALIESIKKQAKSKNYYWK